MAAELESLFERFARRGDVEALEQVFDRAAPELLRIALHLAPDAAQAEDLVQATFVRALENAARFDPARALLPWLIGILAHEAARARRDGARAVDPGRLAERASVDPAEESAVREVSAQLGAAVRALPSPYRDVLAPHLLEGERAVDIARRLERAPGTVRMQILRGLELLRQALPPSLATAALLATGTRGHAAVRAAVRARAAELAPTLAPPPPLARLLPMVPRLALALALPALVLTVVTIQRDPQEPAAPARSASVPLVEHASVQPPQGGTGRAPQSSAPRALPPAAPGRQSAGATELAGCVLDAQGVPVAGARVTLGRGEARGFELLDLDEAHASELVGEAVSDGAGAFRFALERGMPVDVRAELGAYSADAPNRYAGQLVELRLDPPHLVQGRVTRASDGAPVAGAEVRVFGQGGGEPSLARSTASAADGSYELRLTFTEGATLAVVHAEAGTAPWLELAFDAEGNAQENVVLAPGFDAVGRVTDAQSGAPIADAVVGESWTFQRTARTDSAGRYRLANWDARAPLYAAADGYGRGAAGAPPRVVDGEARIDFQLLPAHAASGRIVDESARPLAGVYVAAVGENDRTCSARTDVDGRFYLGPLSRENGHALFVTQRGRAARVYDFPASESGAGPVDLGQIVLGSGQLVAGRVVDGAGNAVAGASVTLAGWNSDRFVLCGGDDSDPKGGMYVRERRALADGDGRFWFGGVAPGSYELSAVQTGRRESAPLRLLVQEGEDREDLQVTFVEGLTIRGTVRDPLGRPLAEAHVAAFPEAEGTGLWVPTARAGADGAFEIGGLAAGAYQLETSMIFVRDDTPDEPWIWSYLDHVAAGGEPVTIVLERGATIAGVVRDASGRPVAQALVFARPDDPRVLPRNTDAAGRFHLDVPKDTVWTIEAYADGACLASVAGVTAGTHDLVLRAP